MLQKGEELIGCEGLKLPLSILGAESPERVRVAVHRSFPYIRPLMTLIQSYCFLYGHGTLLVVICGLWGYRDTYHTSEVWSELEREDGDDGAREMHLQVLHGTFSREVRIMA